LDLYIVVTFIAIRKLLIDGDIEDLFILIMLYLLNSSVDESATMILLHHHVSQVDLLGFFKVLDILNFIGLE
jgi:hypothetical protein